MRITGRQPGDPAHRGVDVSSGSRPPAKLWFD
jgi:hypothetical protein